MIAVVKIAGQQFKVEKDQTLYVPHLPGNAGDAVALDVLLMDARIPDADGINAIARIRKEYQELRIITERPCPK